MSTRLDQAKPAVRTALKGRMMLSGPPGSGKTRSALIMATDLAQGEKILGIDTEKESMATYADDFTYTHLKWLPPYDPRELSETLIDAGDKYGVIIIDSLSHFWRAQGGTLDIANGKYTGWKDARPAQEELVEAILSVPAHVIVCVRSKIDYVQEQESNGKFTVRKLGMAAQQDDTLEYEMNIAVDLAIDHTATISKTRTTVLPVGRAFRAGHVVELAEIYRGWLAGGEAPAPANKVAEIVGVLNDIEADNEHSEARKAAKAAFLATCGRPEMLPATRGDEALEVARRLAAEAAQGPGEAGPTLPSGTGADVPTPPSTAAQAAPAGGGDAPDPEALQMDVERAIKGLPTARQQPCRDELRKTFGDLSAASVEDLRGALDLIAIEAAHVEAPEPIHTKDPASLPGAATSKPLNAKQRELVSYGRNAGIDHAQLVALASLLHETTEPRPLNELNDMGVLQVKRMVDRVGEKEIVFETPNGVLIAKEVVPA